MDTFRKLMGPDTADRFAAKVVDAVAAAYDENAERHDPDRGDDGLTYAVCVWRNSWHHLEAVLADFPGVVVSRPNGSFQVAINGFLIHVYKAGTSPEDVRAARFDRGLTRMSLVQDNCAQMTIWEELAGAGSHPRDFVRSLRQLVITHCGSPDEGMTGIFIGAPIENAPDGSAWWWLDDLDGKAGAPAIEPPSLTEVPRPTRQEPELDIRVRDREDEAVTDEDD